MKFEKHIEHTGYTVTVHHLNELPPYLVVKIVNWDFSERVKSVFIQENQNG